MLLVTGITGHTGRYFLQELINHNYEEPIRCVVRETSDTTLIDNSGLNIEKVIGDINDYFFTDQALRGVKTIMHIYNIHHSPMIVELAIKNEVERVILVHTTGIYSRFKNASQEYKLIEEKISQMLKNCNGKPAITILRPSMIYGDLCDSNMSKFIKMVDKLRVMPVISGGESLIQPVNARDLGKAFYKVLISPTQTNNRDYDLSGETPIKMIEVFRIISTELNKKTLFINVPLGIGIFSARVVKTISLGKIDYIERVQRMAEDRSYSHTKATTDFSYQPIAFETGIKKEVKEYQNIKKNRVGEIK